MKSLERCAGVPQRGGCRARGDGPRHARPGVTLIEMLIAMVVAAIIGAALTGLLANQSRLVDQQEKLGEARFVSRSALNVLLADLRMVEREGILALDDSTITVRAPYRMGISCGSNFSATTVRLLPTDTAMLARTHFAGWAYREGFGANDGYAYVTSGPGMTSGTVSLCTNNGVQDLDGGHVGLTPAQALATPGLPVLLFQEVTFRFRASTSLPGQRGLFRQVGDEPAEELVAPFSDAVRFRYFVAGSETPQDAVPADLTTVAGIEVVLDGRSLRPPSGGGYETAALSSAIFFKNR